MPKITFIIDFFPFVFYIFYSRYIKPYHLLVSPPLDVLTGISYDPPLTDPCNFIKICQNTPQLCWGDEWPPLSPGRQPGRASGPEGGRGLG